MTRSRRGWAESPTSARHGAVRAPGTSAAALAALLGAAGVVHVVAPSVFASAIPPELPGTPKAWIIGSGVAEAAVAAALLVPATRRAGAGAAAALFVAVFPGNVQMLRGQMLREASGGDRSRRRRAVLWLRLPLQVPLVVWAWRARRP